MQPLPTAVKTVVWPVIQGNAYWAHHENVLLALVADSDTSNRELAIKRITAIRQQTSLSTKGDVGLFKVPKVDQNVQNLKDLLPPMERSLTEPPLIKEISTEELNKLAKNPLTIKIPCHSQRVERCIKMVTEAFQQVYGKDSRDGYIRAKIKSRHFIPAYRSKHDFKIADAQ